jgi:hypothetical protein
MPIFWAKSGYGAKIRKPFVQLHHGDWTIQISPDEARQVAQFFIEAAESAEQDGFLVEWAKHSIGADDGTATSLLVEFRKWRENPTNQRR